MADTLKFTFAESTVIALEAYKVAVENGFSGTYKEWLASISPVRGVDYWTEADKAELLSDLLESGESINDIIAKAKATIANAEGAESSLSEATTKAESVDEKLVSDTAKANTADSTLKATTSEANTANSNLKSSTTSATTAKSNLDASVTKANTAKTNLDNSTSAATTAKANLDSSISSANTAKSALDTSTSNANTTKTNLDTANAEAVNNIEQLEAVGVYTKDEVDSKVSELSSEIVYEATLNEVVRTITWEYGTIKDGSSELVDSTQRLRTTSFVDTLNKPIHFVTPTRDPFYVAIWINDYDEDMNYVGNSGSYATGHGDFYYNPKGRYIGIIAKLIDINTGGDYGGILATDCDKLKMRSVMPSASIDTTLEDGAFGDKGQSSYARSDAEGYSRSAFRVKTGSAKFLKLVSDVDATNFSVCQYKSDHSFIAKQRNLDVNLPVKLADGTSEVNITISKQSLDTLKLELYLTSGEVKEIKQSRMSDPYEWIPFKVTQSSYSTMRLLTPSNYDPEGVPVPLILYMDGSGNFTNFNASLSSKKLPWLKYLRDEGFAVLSIFGWDTFMLDSYGNCGNAHPYPTPTGINCIKKGVEYVCSRWNVDSDRIHVISKSQGGQMALWLATHNVINARSIGMFSPVLDYMSMPGEAMYRETRLAIANDMFLTGDVEYFGSEVFNAYSNEGKAFLKANLEQLCSFNEAWAGLCGGTSESRFEDSFSDCKTFWTEEIWNTDRDDLYTHTEYAKMASVPVKIWGARDDHNTPYLKMVEVVEQLKNGGTEAHLVTLANGTGGHSCADTGSNRVASITTELGVEYTNVPIGWVENIKWIRSKDGYAYKWW